jgi:hypothetical protein
VKFQCKIATVIDEASPEFAAFPPPVISRVGPEYQQHGYGESKKSMHNRNVLYITFFGKTPVIKFKPGYEPGINTDGNNEREKLSDSISFVKSKNETKPIFSIVIDHETNLDNRLPAAKENEYPTAEQKSNCYQYTIADHNQRSIVVEVDERICIKVLRIASDKCICKIAGGI